MKDKKKRPLVERLSIRMTEWVGTPASVVVHTILFIGAFASVAFGTDLNTVLLVLTTAVSLEAIYLAIFIQMTVNRHSESLEDIEEDIEQFEESLEDVEEDIDELTKRLKGRQQKARKLIKKLAKR